MEKKERKNNRETGIDPSRNIFNSLNISVYKLVSFCFSRISDAP